MLTHYINVYFSAHCVEFQSLPIGNQ